MNNSEQSLLCKPYRDEVLEYFRHPSGQSTLSPAARMHYDRCVDCVESVARDAFNRMAEDGDPWNVEFPEAESAEARELRKVFAEWGIELPSNAPIPHWQELLTRGRELRERGQMQTARDAYSEALKRCRDEGNKAGILRCLLEIASADRAMRDLTSARDHFVSALRLSDELESREAQAVAQLNLGRVFFDAGELDQARDAANRALNLNQEIRRFGGTQLALRLLSEIDEREK